MTRSSILVQVTCKECGKEYLKSKYYVAQWNGKCKSCMHKKNKMRGLSRPRKFLR